MRIALPVWNDRISPVFDTAQRFMVVEIEGNEEISRDSLFVPGIHFYDKARKLRDAGVDVLICGAISNHAMSVVCANGMRVIPWVSGNADEVLNSFRRGALMDGRFAMPGCRRRMGRRMGRRWMHPAGRMRIDNRGPKRS